MTRKSRTLLAMIAAVLIAPAAVGAQPWIGAPGAGGMDEQSLGIYRADTGLLGYNTSSTAAIVTRYTVTDTSGTGTPPWTTLELQYFDNSPNSVVSAYLYRYTATGPLNVVTSCTSTDAPAITSLACSLMGHSVNFNAGNIYTLVVTISRTSTSVTPYFTGVRIY